MSTSTANIQATTDSIYRSIERFKVEMLHGEESADCPREYSEIDQIKEQFSNHITIVAQF